MPADVFRSLLRAIVAGDRAAVRRLLEVSPALATAAARDGATRAHAVEHFFPEIGHYVYGGDTALHIAAAAHRPDICRRLIALGADVRARNRRGAEPLHYAADGGAASRRANATAQARAIGVLLAAGADPNALDKSGVAPLHRAVRTRSAAAVRALIAGGADPSLSNARGSTPRQLASRTTGASGSGSPAAKAQQAAIIDILEQHGAA